ncbi:hypothetical protein H3H54_15510 [Brachybacterium sp. Z12]|uniref:hypothetical protein n=1 Tax=Brachybacterium sp. Z12 TaxID=2759167 RepID=UPI001861F5DC|nr:hypothetical protein [Brachybacterium sp. Z12]QNN82392.1 hypothetical protein H3H54_15510 [Brachybacterium sp. Z12]
MTTTLTAPAPLLATGPTWPGDWSTFWPDMVIGCITGLLIGLALWLLQIWADQRHSRKVARRVSLRIVQPLLLALQRPTYTQGFSEISVLPRRHRAALSLIEQSDLDDWHEELATELTETLRDYRGRLWNLQADADDLEQAVERWFAVHRTSPVVREWVEARLLGASEDYLRAMVRADDDYEPIAAAGAQIVTSRLVRKHARAYGHALRKADRTVQNLMPILIENVRRPANR